MATAAIAGFTGVVYLSKDGGTTKNKIGELREATLTIETETIDATSHDSNRWREFIDGIRSWSFSAEALYVTGNAAQEDVLDILLGDQNATVKWQPKAGTGLREFTGACKITSCEMSQPNDDAVALSIEGTGTGALTDAVQS